jgi:Cu-processing system ATP-binding protein
MIRISKIEKSFGKLKVLDNVSLGIPPAKITAVLGPNGSGKTTLIKSILGMVIPDKGDIYIGEINVKNNWEYRLRINYMPQINNFPENLTLNDLIKLLNNVRGQKGDPEFFIEAFGLESFLKKRVKHLSGGTKQKANIMLACMFNNDILIMDEPTSGLDPLALVRLKTFIRTKKKEGKTVLITTHIMSVVEELADEIVFLLEGKVYYQGNLADLNTLCGTESLEHAMAFILKEPDLSKNYKLNGTHDKSMAVQHL